MPLFTKNGKRQVVELPIASIRPNPDQPRRHFDPSALEELSRSISQVGILQPLTVRRRGGHWELISGERRLRAAEAAGLSVVPCLIMEVTDDTSSLLALVENIQRADLNVWEEALALRKLIEEHHLSQEEAGHQIGISQSAVANKLRLLRLPQDIIAQLQSANLTERHARALLRLSDPQQQRDALAHILRFSLNVAKTELYIDRLCQKKNTPRKAVPIYRTKDVRLFLNTIKKSLAIMQSAGVNASFAREESEREILLTIHIPK